MIKSTGVEKSFAVRPRRTWPRKQDSVVAGPANHRMYILTGDVVSMVGVEWPPGNRLGQFFDRSHGR